ncbi:L,D-transpeptidase family protein [Sphingorhabdus sp.]|uniref:L,D-transpeptidase family protein n=1 Tax=Sphingorhabdus sp. TaxID=1902408 RepID=UPI003918747A
MKFGNGIRTLQGLFALALVIAVPNTAIGQSRVQGQAVPVPQSQSPMVVPVEPQTPKPEVDTPTTAATPAVPTPDTTSPVAEQEPKPRKKGPIDALRPGQFVWAAQDVYEGPMKIVIVLDIQRIYVFQNDKLVGFSTISSGKKGKETPTGIFNILQKNVDHKSNLYSNAPMPYMQRLTWDGIALHGGYLPGYPASHGCIRLPHAFAKALYGVTQMNQEVVILQDTSTPVKRPPPPPMVDPEAVPAEPPVDPSFVPPVATQPPASNSSNVFPDPSA